MPQGSSSGLTRSGPYINEYILMGASQNSPLNVSYQLFNIVRLNNITLLDPDPVLQCEILILRAYQIEEAVAQG